MKSFSFSLSVTLVSVLLAGGKIALGDTYSIDFSGGVDPSHWATENWPGGGSSPYTFTTTGSGELVSKPVTGQYGAYGKLHFTPQILGDFDARVYFRDLSLPWSGNGSPGNMIELYTQVGSDVSTAVRANFPPVSGSDYHMFTTYPSNNQYGHVATSDTSGALRLTRTGSMMTGYYLDHDGVTWDQIAASANFLTGPVALALHLGNCGTPDAISVTWQDFSVTATTITPEPSTFVLLCVGAISLAALAWRWRRAV